MLKQMCDSARKASAILGNSNTETRNSALSAMADALVERASEIILANSKDLENAKQNGMSDAMLDRLTLTEARISAISQSVKKVIALPDPLESSEKWVRPNGLEIAKKRVPLGVVVVPCFS